jgi:hypothetical protein
VDLRGQAAPGLDRDAVELLSTVILSAFPKSLAGLGQRDASSSLRNRSSPVVVGLC